MQNFPDLNEWLFHVPSQKRCIVLGGCIGSKLVTVKFEKGMVLSIRMSDLVLNEPVRKRCCGCTAIPDQHGVCKSCRETYCPECGKCNCN